MKAAILDYAGMFVEIADIPKEYEELSGDDIISRMGYKLDNIYYMIVDDDIPIFCNGEQAPVITL